MLAGFALDKTMYSRVPRQEENELLKITHPRYLVIPKIGMNIAPALLFSRTLFTLRRLQKHWGDFDIIDAHYFYPDGVAAAMLGRSLGKPVVITARGSDVNSIAGFRLPRTMISWAAETAQHVITVSSALKDALLGLGVSESKISVLRNGVDLETFQPLERIDARQRLALRGPTLLSVGNLIKLKGHELIIKALPALANYDLLVCGDGPMRTELEALARELGVGDRVRFLGRLRHEELPLIYSAADALVLASSREGWPNVLLEAMACGTPALGTRVGGIPEVIAEPAAGGLISERSSVGIATAVNELFANLPGREATRAYAEKFSWDFTTRGQIEVFQKILAHQKDPLSHVGHVHNVSNKSLARH
jgi:teichuronic acid biosynthesis glycosyltransferase TuaC